MWGRIHAWLARRPARVAKNPGRQPRRLTFQPLETRELMAGIPALSSLPNAPRTIYLDFDGDTQPVWNRTDWQQTYTNVVAGEFDIDDTAGIGKQEVAAIHKIWEMVADDYAPFNVNVTTVAPKKIADGVALRVVIGGHFTATLQTGDDTSVDISGDSFIGFSNGSVGVTSGYAAIGSFTNSEPNVVYVFAKYLSTWPAVDSEGRSVTVPAMIATTASHEAGHSFGLVHHGDYDVGTDITTPIMGANAQGDRSIWSNYESGNVKHDNLRELTKVLGARPDDFADGYAAAKEFKFTNFEVLRGVTGTASGVISQRGDTDMFRLTVGTARTYNFSVSVPQFGNLDSQLLLYKVTTAKNGRYILQTITSADPAIPADQPFQGLGASFSAFLQPGKYAIAVQSHGSYGDLGSYTLSVQHSGGPLATDPNRALFDDTSLPSNSSSPSRDNPILGQSQPPLGGPRGAGAGLASPLSVLSTTKATTPSGKLPGLPASEVDAVMAAWSEVALMNRHLLPTSIG